MLNLYVILKNGIKKLKLPVSGLFEYYDVDENWVASINFGDGECDEWATKTWDVNLFPNYPLVVKIFRFLIIIKIKKIKKINKNLVS